MLLFDFFVNSMFVAVSAKFIQFQPSSGIPAVFGAGVAGNPWRALSKIAATLRTFQRDDDSNALSHDLVCCSLN